MVGLAPLEPRDQSLSAMGLVVTRIIGVAKNQFMPSPPAAPAMRFEFGKPHFPCFSSSHYCKLFGGASIRIWYFITPKSLFSNLITGGRDEMCI